MKIPSMFWQIKKCYEDWGNEIFRLIEKPNIDKYGGWNEGEDLRMVHLDSLCSVFDENEAKQFKNTLEKVDALACPNQDKALPKFRENEYHEFKIYFKQIEMLSKEVASS